MLKEELQKLKAFALLVGTEHQSLTEELKKQKDRVRVLTKITESIKFEGGTSYKQLNQGHNCTMTAKQAGLEEKRPLLRKTDGFWELNAKERGFAGPGLMSEVEVLRRRVVEMEGKDEELVRMAEQCRELEQRLTKEKINCSNLRDDVDKLNRRINELDRIEGALVKSRQESSSLKGSLEREKEVCKTLNVELDKLRVILREMEDTESQLQQSEGAIKQDVAKLRSLTVALVEERNSMTERLRQAEETLSRKDGRRNEQSNLVMKPERFKDQKQQADLEERIKNIAKEKDEFHAKLKTEGEKSSELEAKLSVMRRRLQVLENRKEKEEKRENVKYAHGSLPNNSSHQCQTQNNKVNELSQELERLRKTLQDKEVLEGELLKVEEDYEGLERKFKEEQKRTQALTQELEEAKCELSRYQQAEKQEINQEHQLLCRLQREQVKSRLLGREVESLKEKLQGLVGTDDCISKVQNDHSALQKKLSQQEAKNRELAREMQKLSTELDRYKPLKTMTYDTNRFALQTKEVQTDPNEINYSTTVIANLDEDKDEEDPNQNTDSSSHIQNLNNLNSANNNISVFSNSGSSGLEAVNREVMMLTHTPGQPLHIKVTPHHMLNTATLEITSPSADVAASYTSTAVIPTSPGQSKQRITIIQNSNSRSPPSSPDRSISSFNTSPIARVLSPNSPRSVTPDHNSPIQIVTVRTCSPELEAASPTGMCKSLERHERSNSIDTSSSISSLDDSKIHIHLGSPYIQAINGVGHSIPHGSGPYYVRHEQRTQVLANGCHVKGVGKITSSITISPATSPVSNITVSGLCD